MEQEKVDTVVTVVDAVRPVLDNWMDGIVGEISNIHQYRDGSFSVRVDIEQNLGIFSQVIREAWLSLQIHEYYTKARKLFIVTVDLSYKHPNGGSNGSSIGKIDLDYNTFEVLETYTEHERADETERRFAGVE